jgi:O-antigen/teichoic acid export membrane protein
VPRLSPATLLCVTTATLDDAPARAPQSPHAAAPSRLSGGARIVHNISVLGFGQIFTWLTTMGLVALLPRYLGDENLGKLATAVSLTDLAGLIASMGITSYLTKEVARKASSDHPEILNALASRLPLALLAAAASAVAASALGFDDETRQIVYLLCINIVLSALGGVLLGALQGMQEMQPVAIVGALSKGVYLALVAVGLLGGHGLVGVAIASNIAGAVTVVGYLVPLVRRGALRGPIDMRTWRVLIVGSLPFFIWQAALMVYGQVDVILLQQLTRDAVVGWYVAAYRIVGIPVFVPVIVAAAVFPALSQAVGRDLSRFVSLARKSLHLVLLLTIPMAIGIMVTAERILDFLSYPDAFRNSIPLIMILAIHIPLVGADMVIGNVLNSRDRQRRWAMTGVAAAVLNPSLNFLLIPYFDQAFANGAIGAATSTVLTELFMMVMGLWLLRGSVFDRSSLLFGFKCFAGALGMTGAVLLMRELPLPLTVIVGAATYATVSVAIGTVALTDLRVLGGYLRQRVARNSVSV